MNPILALSGLEQARLIREGEISSVELIRAHLERIAEINPTINAAVATLEHTAPPAARHAALRRKHGELLRPFEGVPFSVKDSISIAGQPCTAGTWGFRNNPPSHSDATLVARLRNAGAIPIARTNLPDL